MASSTLSDTQLMISYNQPAQNATQPPSSNCPTDRRYPLHMACVVAGTVRDYLMRCVTEEACHHLIMMGLV
jgi:hypothetical protein